MNYYRDMPAAQVTALEKAIKTHNMGFNNINQSKWRDEAIDNIKFKDGLNQWPQHIINELRAKGQEPLVVNKIKPLLNQISGQQINTRSKFGYASHSFAEEPTELAKALTHLGYYYQESLNYSQKGSVIVKDVATVGVGWSRTYRNGNKMFYERVHPLFMTPDIDDISEQFTNMQFVTCMFPLSLEEIKLLWPHKAKRVEDDMPLSVNDMRTGDFLSELMVRNTSMQGIDSRLGSKPLVIEVQYKVAKKYFSGIDRTGNTFSTFNEEEAEDIAEEKKNIEEKRGTQIMRDVFWRNILLEHAPLDPNIPNLEDFTYIPQLWGRRDSDFVPSGVVEDVKGLQRESNYRKQKEINSLDSFRVIADDDAFPNYTDEEARMILSRSDAFIRKRPESKVEVIPNMDLARGHIEALARNDFEFEQVSGVYRDSFGEQTNATSGVAIKARQVGSARNLAPAFDSVIIRQKREGRMLLNFIQTTTDRNIIVQFLDEDEQKELMLNIEREIDGKKYMFNDIRSFPAEVYVKPTPDFDSSPEEIAERLQEFLQNPNAPDLAQNTELMKLMMLPGYKKISAAMQQTMQNKIAMQQGGMPSGQPQIGNGGDMDMDAPHL